MTLGGTWWWRDQDNLHGLDKAYRAAMGVPAYVDDMPGQVEIEFHQTHNATTGWGPLMVRIRVDGYEAHFPHDGTLRIPPPSEWVKIPIPTNEERNDEVEK